VKLSIVWDELTVLPNFIFRAKAVERDHCNLAKGMVIEIH
jgi:hypothetical protein